MSKNYIHKGFSDLDSFLAHHRSMAAGGDENSARIMDTHVRIEQETLYRQSPARYLAGAFESGEALIQK